MRASVSCEASMTGRAERDLPGKEIDLRLIENCRARGFDVEVHQTAGSALAQLLELIPAGADVTTGSSQTLIELGVIPYLDAGSLKCRYRRAEIARAEADEERQTLRRAATTADYIVGSVNALARTGEAVVADFGGTRVAAYAYGARNVIWVVGMNKIVPTVEHAVRRVRDYVLPLEARRVADVWQTRCAIGKMMIIEEEPQSGRIRLLLVNESLGF